MFVKNIHDRRSTLLRWIGFVLFWDTLTLPLNGMSAESTLPDDFDREFHEEVEAIERELVMLKERYATVMAAEREREPLKARLAELKPRAKNPDTRQELQEVRARIGELEHLLESRLVNLWEPFWMAVRFGGLGIVIGWLLHRI
jgi:hypothetical protein